MARRCSRLDKLYKSARVNAQLDALDVRMDRLVPTSRAAGYEICVRADTVSRLCQDGQCSEAVEALGVLVHTDCYVSRSLFYAVLRECVARRDLPLGRRVHALSVRRGYESDTFLCNHILRMYASHSRLQESVEVFSVVANPDAFTWSAIISAHVKHGLDKQAIQLYHRMRSSNVKPDGHVFVAALQACGRGADLKSGQQVHADVLGSGIEPDLFVSSCLVDMYAKCGSLDDAQRLFDGLPQKDVVTWNAMIAGYSQQGMGQKALCLYNAMEEEGLVALDSVTFVCLLQACSSVGLPALEKGRQLHIALRAQGLEADLFVASSLLTMYAKCGSLGDAQRVFDRLDQKNVVTWSAMIGGYSQQGMGQEALRLYRSMQGECHIAPDSVTFVCLLQGCASLGISALETGKQLHAHIRQQGLEADVFIASSLVSMYAKCGSLADARDIFNGLSEKNVVTWNAMIAGYSQQGMGQEALCLYKAMQEESVTSPDSFTYVSLLQACSSVGAPALDKGKEFHAQIRQRGFQADVFVANSLVNMYVKCGSLEDAQILFYGLPQKDLVTWSAMIAGYSHHGMGQEALQVYRAMQEEGIVTPNSVTFVCLLQACASVGTLGFETGKQLHAQIREQELLADVSVASSLVNMYAKCGSLEDARRMFDRLSEKNVVTWSAMIAGYSQQGMGQEALRLYGSMQEEGAIAPNLVTFVSLLQACASLGNLALEQGKQLHAQIQEQGLQTDDLIASSLISMYAKCGGLEDAQSVFVELGRKTVVTWNAMIAGYSQQGMVQEALDVYGAMQEEGTTTPDSATFGSLLQACASVGTLFLQQGKELHAQIRGLGLDADVGVVNKLVDMYARCGSLEGAQVLFDGLSQKDVLTWNAMIAGYAREGMGQEALRLYSAMQEEGMAAPNSVTLVSVLQACAGLSNLALEKGKQLHAQIKEQGLQDDAVVGGSMVNMYAKCGSLGDAREVFEGLAQKTVVTWNAMIAGYSQQGMGQEALLLYSAMQDEGITAPDSLTFVPVLQACASLGTTALEKGRQLHAQITEQGHDADLFVASSLIKMYATCGSLEDARRVFDGLDEKDVVMWTCLIAGYSKQGMGQEALDLYSAMQGEGVVAPDFVTFLCLLQACASFGNPGLEKGKQLHSQIREEGLQTDVFVASGLVNMYAKCGSIENAQGVFDELGQKTVVMWNAMIAGYSQHGMRQEALDIFKAMQEEGTVAPNSVTFVCLLQACANVAALHLGRQLHKQIEESGLQSDVLVVSSLINMYGKCGCMVDAQQAFDALPERTVGIWSALIAGYTRQGESDVVFDLVFKMREDGLQPDGITFLSVLTVCSHTGLVEKGQEYFEAMSTKYGVTPTTAHYTCMVDILGRAGQLDEALDLVRTMPVMPDAAVWHSLLGGCQKWSNVEVGRHAFKEAVKLDPKDATAYVLMSNIYNGAQMWDKAHTMQVKRKRMRAWKQPGLSWWTDMDGLVHNFSVKDKKHRLSETSLTGVSPQMTKEIVLRMDMSPADISVGEKKLI